MKRTSPKTRRAPAEIIGWLFVALLALPAAAPAAIVEGTVYDADSNDPIPRVTIRIEGTGRSMLGNDSGRYRLRLEPGTYTVRFSHVAHYSETVDVAVGELDTAITRDVRLKPSLIELPGTRVYTRAYDPAQEIIIEAIRRKEALLSQIQDYTFEAYTKLAVRRLEDDTLENYLLITETQLSGWFQQPDQYKEIITARRQSSNLDAEGNLVTVGQIFNFNANRIELGRQAVVSPTASDALDYYNYYLLDTILVDGRPAFQLEIEPQSNAHPLFDGEILIVDSLYAVVGVDVTVNEAFDAPYLSNLRFSQRYARFEGDIWMPVEIRFNGKADLPIPVVPDLAFFYTAALNRLVFNEGIPPGTFDEYAIEVAREADEVDSSTWDEGALIPLTVDEAEGYRHIDSIENKPPSIWRVLLNVAGGTMMLVESRATYDFFHFNRVEGAYLGAGVTLDQLIPRTDLYLKSGWAFDGEYWQHHYRATHTLSDRHKLRLAWGFHDEIVPRPTVFVDNSFNPSLISLWDKTNPLDYYLEKGFDVSLSVRPLQHTQATISYHDLNQYSVDNSTNYGIFDTDKDHRANPPIINGKLRNVGARFIYDSRPMIRNKGRDDTLFTVQYTRLESSFEWASDDIVENDFEYRRYDLSLYRSQRLSGFGVISLYAYGGLSDRALPPQRYFTADFGDVDNITLNEFKTLDETNFRGDRLLALYVGHDFGTSLFRRLNVPVLKNLPFSFLVYGGTFWSDFNSSSLKVDGGDLVAAPEGYSEIGFGFGRLPPLFLRLYFTWQLTAFDTRDFSVKFSMGF